MVVCGLSLHQGSTESRKTLEQKFIFQIGTLNPNSINERIFSVISLAGDVKGPTHLSEKIGDEIPEIPVLWSGLLSQVGAFGERAFAFERKIT